MLSGKSGRQAAGRGYGIFWLGLLIETVNSVHAALLGSPLEGPRFGIRTVLITGCTIFSIALLMNIRHRTW